MRAVIQRVAHAELSVGGKPVSAIGQGLAVYLGIAPQDGEPNAVAMAKKLAALRIFSDEEGKMNRSVRDVGGEVLLISQFTLYGAVHTGTDRVLSALRGLKRRSRCITARLNSLHSRAFPYGWACLAPICISSRGTTALLRSSTNVEACL